MKHVLACIDTSAYTASVCDLAAWASKRLDLPVELLHVVQRNSAVTLRHDHSGAIGLGAKTDLLVELTRLEEADAHLQIERGRVLLATATERLKAAGATGVIPLHRHGGIVETILEREADARAVVIGKRGASHEFATDHIGSKIERVVRASTKPVLIASRRVVDPSSIVLAYDASKPADRALDRIHHSPLFKDLPVHIVMAGRDDDRNRNALRNAQRSLPDDRPSTTALRPGKPEEVIAEAVANKPDTLLVMGAYGHSPLRTLIVGSTTTAMIRTVHVPVLLVR
jgi:nucleotide-binding universal stress UspA family protein